MKIVAMLPFKNEEWVLPAYISSLSKIADEIIALDDNSAIYKGYRIFRILK